MREDGIFVQIRRRTAAALRCVRRLMIDYAYVFTLAAALAVMAASGIYTRSLHARQEGIQAAAEAAELQETPTPSPAPTPTAAPLNSLRRGGNTVMPTTGGVLRGFDREKPVFWERLSCWQVHTAIDIAGSAQEEVRCVMDGTVERTVRDDLWGWRIRIAQTDGQTAEYAGLLLCQAEEGEHVTRGQTLGVLMESIPCEAELGPHLHLSLYSGGVPVDPSSILPKGTGVDSR